MERILKYLDKKISYKYRNIDAYCTKCGITQIEVLWETIRSNKVLLKGQCVTCNKILTQTVADFIKPITLSDNQGILLKIPYY